MNSSSLASSLVRITLFASALALLTQACGGAGGGSTPPPGDPDPTPPAPTASFELSLSADKLPVLTGGSATIEVTLTRKGGFDGVVTLAPAGLPPQVTATFAPETLPGGDSRSTLTIAAPAGTPHSLPTAVTIRAAAGDKQATRPLTVTITGAPGTLDTSFGAADGKAIVPVGASDDYAFAMAVQPDGKIVIAGRAAENRGDFALVRLERDGVLDATFGAPGSPGKVLTDFAGGGDTAYAVAIQPDGKIVVAGTALIAASGQDFAVARYNADGSLDAGFGAGGKLTTAFSTDSDTAYAMLLQADGKIVVGGDSYQGTSGTGVDFALARYNADGALDAGFGAGGKLTTALADFSARDSIYALALQTVAGEARIVAAGGEGDFAVARYLPDGALDATFGAAGTGKVTSLMGSSIGAARAVRIAADNKMVLAGHVGHQFALVRLAADGQVDGGFGSTATPGKVITPMPASRGAEAQGLAIDADGKLVVAGWASEANSTAGNFAVLRYLTDGQLDTTFGGTGMVITPVAEGTRGDQASAVLLQADDRIPAVRVLLAGQASGSNSDFAVTRYWR
jgi:uncharacterized delta-60 repeat protein